MVRVTVSMDWILSLGIMNCLLTLDENTCPFSGVYQGKVRAVSNLSFFETVGFGGDDDGDVVISSDS